jgi:putative SOS response-associated peptidase YedK
MCGRFAFFAPRDAVAALFGVHLDVAPESSWNIAPTQPVLAIRAAAHGADGPKAEHGEAAILRWGLVPFWAKDTSIGSRMINARVETLHEKPAFRAALTRRRCVIIASGF